MVRTHAGWLAGLLILCLVGGPCARSEIIPVNNGTGWDGSVYAMLIRDFPSAYHARSIPAVRVSRALPCFLLHRALRIAGLPPTDANVIRLCRAWNVLVLALT